MNADAVFVILAIAMVWGAGALLLDSQRLRANLELPLWTFLRRRGMGRRAVAEAQGERATLHAEIRCALCGSSPACEAAVRAGAASPPSNCPNSELFTRTVG